MGKIRVRGRQGQEEIRGTIMRRAGPGRNGAKKTREMTR